MLGSDNDSLLINEQVKFLTSVEGEWEAVHSVVHDWVCPVGHVISPRCSAHSGLTWTSCWNTVRMVWTRGPPSCTGGRGSTEQVRGGQ